MIRYLNQRISYVWAVGLFIFNSGFDRLMNLSLKCTKVLRLTYDGLQTTHILLSY